MKLTGVVARTLFAGLVVAAANASPVCTINGTSQPLCYTGSYSTGVISSFATNQTINWGDLYGGPQTGAPNGSYTFNSANTAWIPSYPTGGTSDVANISLGPSFGGGLNNTVYVWGNAQYAYDGTNYYDATNPGPGQTGANVEPMNFQNTVADNPQTDNFGDTLVGYSNAGSGPVIITFNNPVSAAGFRISSFDATQFTTTVTAYDQSGNALGYTTLDTANTVYNIGDTLPGGGTNTTTAAMYDGGICQQLAGNLSNTNGIYIAQCNTAPFAGIDQAGLGLGSDTNPGQIYSIGITVTSDNPLGPSHGFAIDTLALNVGGSITTPEPAGFFTLCGGLLGLAFLLRKRAYALKG